MKKAAISITIAIVLVLVMFNVLSPTHYDVEDDKYECFGADCEYYIVSEHHYAFFDQKSPVSIMGCVYSYSVHDNHIFLCGIIKRTTPTYMVVDYKNKSNYYYNNAEDSPVEYRKYLAHLPTHPTLPETLLTRWLRKHVF